MISSMDELRYIQLLCFFCKKKAMLWYLIIVYIGITIMLRAMGFKS